MNKTLKCLAALALAAALLLGAAAALAGGAVQFADPAFEAAVRSLLALPQGDIVAADVENVTELRFGKLAEKTIESLEGIEAFVSLQSITLNGQAIADVSPLAGLAELAYVELGDNDISDLSPFSGTNIRALLLYGNRITDVSPLAGMPALDTLILAGNQIRDVSPLAGLTTLRVLMLTDNPVGDTTVLADVYGQLTQMDFLLKTSEPVRFADPVLEKRVYAQLGIPAGTLTAAGAEAVWDLNVSSAEGETEAITDLGGIEAFSNLGALAVISNAVTDITPLAALTKLEYLDLGGNRIEDIAPLEGMNLRELALWGNRVRDLTPLAGMYRLESLDISDNQIGDLAPLGGLYKVTRLCLGRNLVEDLTPLAGLQRLRVLDIGGNRVRDLTPLMGMDLAEFTAYDNQIADLAPLAGMDHLERLDLTNNALSDIRALAGKTQLCALYFGGNEIADYGPVADYYDAIGEKDFALDGATMLRRAGRDPDAVVTFADPVLEARIRETLRLPQGELTAGMAANVTELNLELSGDDHETPKIGSLEGIQAFENLTVLNLGWALEDAQDYDFDLSPLAGLTKLEVLFLFCDTVRDLRPLGGLTGLRSLWIWGNNDLSDISALAGLTGLEDLWMYGDGVTDISALQNMPNLWRLLMQDNRVVTLAPLNGLPNLRELSLGGNPVWDYYEIADLYPRLTERDFDLGDAPAYRKPANPDEVIVFADAALERRVREQMNIPQGDITALDAARVTELNFSVDWNETLTDADFIRNIEGLQYFLNLQSLSLYNNEVRDLTPLAGLTRLTYLDLNENDVYDITPLTNLTELEILTFTNSEVEDISALAGMTKLCVLQLRNNPVADYTPIEALYPTIDQTDFAYGEVFEKTYKPADKDAVVTFADPVLEEKIRAAIGLPAGDITCKQVAFVDALYLDSAADAPIRDLTGMENFLNLKVFELRGGDIRDLSPLAGLKKLETLKVTGAGLTDIGPMASLTTLKWVDISGNQIADIEALRGLQKLQGLCLAGNPIPDHTPIEAVYASLTERDFTYGDVMLAPEDPGAVVVFGDPVFESRVRQQLGMPQGDITAADAARVEALDFNMAWQEVIPPETQIKDLTGIEYFINLKRLSLNFHAVADIGMLPALTKLTELDLGANGISDLTVFAAMPRLRRLVLFANGITDIEPLRGLTQLEYLQLEHNGIADIGPLAGMTALQTLWLNDNPIADYSPVDAIYQNLTDRDF